MDGEDRGMKKILYVCCNFTWGGVEQYILNVLDYIDRSLYQIDVLLPDRVHDREVELEKRNIKVKKYNCTSYKEKILNFYKILKDNQYDIVHLFTGNEAALLCMIAKKAGNKKIIVHSHASKSGDENIKFLHILMKKIYFYLAKVIYRKYALCLACSETAGEFMFGKHNENVRVLGNGIDLDRFHNGNNLSDAMSFVINARFSPPKNPYFVIDIFSELIKKKSTSRLEWVGTGEMEKEIKDYAKNLQIEKYINFLGTVNDVEHVLRRNRFFLLPSIHEGLPIVLIEAQAAGLKCFISDNITKQIDCGGCFKISLDLTAEEWAEIILEEIKKNPVAKIKKDKIEKYSIKYTIKELENIYEEI